MLDKFLLHSKENNLLLTEHKILTAVSGGIDSIVLLHLMHQAKINTDIAHCNFRLRGKESDDDEKHVTPTQLDVIDRIVDLYSNEGETIFTPFMGCGTEVYSAVSMGRKAIGVELKDSYFKQAILNLKTVKNRFKNKVEQTSLF